MSSRGRRGIAGSIRSRLVGYSSGDLLVVLGWFALAAWSLTSFEVSPTHVPNLSPARVCLQLTTLARVRRAGLDGFELNLHIPWLPNAR